MYIAHKNENEVQLLRKHLENTGNLASSFAQKFNAEELAYICGILHDIGKYSKEFQNRINGSKIKVDHSTAGAQLAKEKYEQIWMILGYAIMGHHGGIPNCGNKIDNDESSTLYGRSKKEIKDYSAYASEMEMPVLNVSKIKKLNKSVDRYFSLYLLIKMIHSTLVDADFIDTRNFMQGKTHNEFDSIEELLELLNKYIINMKASDTELNIKRKEIQNECKLAANNKPGIFSLTVPTGGGKTISSLVFALNHAKTNNLDRVIYVVPYTSIIEQNAQIFKEILGEQNVLEHHSNFDFKSSSDQNENKLERIYKLSSENWDIPIIVTTNVQFFESFFSNKPSKCRKLHNISKSVIVLDEAQMIPLDYMKVCLDLLVDLPINFNSTVVMCTATQPEIKNILPAHIEIKEICDNNKELYDFFKRNYIEKIGKKNDDELVELLLKHESFLCIVNTRKDAFEMYKKIKSECGNEDDVYHLSTLMAPKDRKNVLGKIKQNLKNNLPCKVISTQLIEAGVDVDFPVVFRSMAGLDSIIQAAGRCNREGKLNSGKVYVFEPEKTNIKNHTLQRSITCTNSIFREFKDVLEIEAIKKYFEDLYELEGDGLDSYEIEKKIIESKQCNYNFADIANEFKLIDDNKNDLIIPFDEVGQTLVETLEKEIFINNTLRKLQTYTVSIYESEFMKLCGANKIKVVNGASVLSDLGMYKEDTGLDVSTEFGIGIFFD